MIQKVIVIDTETTGFSEEAEVIQLGAIDLEGNVLLDTLVQCQGDIPPSATAIHGITKEMLVDAPTWPEIHDQLSKLLEAADFVVMYNHTYDHRLMRQTAKRHGLTLPRYRTRCAMREYADTYFEGDWVSLSEAAHYENVDTSNIKAHTAIGDCEMTRQVWLALKADEAKKAKQKAKRDELKQMKMKLVPSDVSSGTYTDYGQGWRPPGYKTLSQLRKYELSSYEFAGTCCNAFGDRGYLFKPIENIAGVSV